VAYSLQNVLRSLFILQDSLIEHKFPKNFIAIHEYLISCAGDIYREMTKVTPYFYYVDEKLRTLYGYCYRPGGLTVGDFDEYKRLMGTPYYKPKRDLFLSNLNLLKRRTQAANIEPKRKRVMMEALNMIEALIRWFESLNPYGNPREQLEKLTDAVADYFPREFWRER